ncbi:DUF3859 domain-containing protein [Aliiroseovarius sp.]|uniref:DUF3859 domain-containing protein n=1 Tax=Aliiroseovarius sp. TaxID=1872442 RepID=UPI0026364AB4|nr:DUF3859 domain-containing protein [Aliiroseovarius sp.]
MLRLLLFLVSLVPAAAGANPQVLSVQSGFLCGVIGSGSALAEDTLEGRTDLMDVHLLRVIPTRVAPAAKGIHIGVVLQRDPSFTSPIRAVTAHPPMGPDGVTQQSFFTNQTPDGLVGVGWEFEYSYEMLPGDWSITLYDGATELHRAEFTVVPPALFPQDIDICDGPDLLS